MRRGTSKSGLPMIVPEYTFTVYRDEGEFVLEVSREGTPIRDIDSYDTVERLASAVANILSEEEAGND